MLNPAPVPQESKVCFSFVTLRDILPYCIAANEIAPKAAANKTTVKAANPYVDAFLRYIRCLVP